MPGEILTQAVPLEVPLVRAAGEDGPEVALGEGAVRNKIMGVLHNAPKGTVKTFSGPEGREFILSMRGRDSVEARVLHVRKGIDALVLIKATQDGAEVSLEEFIAPKPGDTDATMSALRETNPNGIPKVVPPAALEAEAHRVAEAQNAAIINAALLAHLSANMASGSPRALRTAAALINKFRARNGQAKLSDQKSITTEALRNCQGTNDLREFVEGGASTVPMTPDQLGHHLAAFELLEAIAKGKGPSAEWAKKIISGNTKYKEVVKDGRVIVESGKAMPTVAQIQRRLQGEDGVSKGLSIEKGLQMAAELAQTRASAGIIAGDAASIQALDSIIGMLRASIAPKSEGLKGGSPHLRIIAGKQGGMKKMEGLIQSLDGLSAEAKKAASKSPNSSAQSTEGGGS